MKNVSFPNANGLAFAIYLAGHLYSHMLALIEKRPLKTCNNDQQLAVSIFGISNDPWQDVGS